VVDLRESEAEYEWELDGRKPPRDLLMPAIIANPVVTPARGAVEAVAEEGCLSFVEIRGDVARPDAISVAYQDERGGAHVLKCNGLLARCIQHEADHLNGVLFIDRMTKAALVEVDAAVKALARKTRQEAKAEKPGA
jgi:peptide deformylase